MTGKRKRYGAEFKARVALEALRGELTTAQLAAKHGVHKTMVGEWKKQAVEKLAARIGGTPPILQANPSVSARIDDRLAEGVGFEPTVRFHAHTLSKRAP